MNITIKELIKERSFILREDFHKGSRRLQLILVR